MASEDNGSGETGRCDVCNNVDNLERVPLVRERGCPKAVDLKTCEVCEVALARYFDTGAGHDE